jgi:hypothetical protein
MDVKEYALIKNSGLSTGYWVVIKETRSYTLYDDSDEAIKDVEYLLANDVEIFENSDEFHKIYPELTIDERLKILKEFPANRHKNRH